MNGTHSEARKEEAGKVQMLVAKLNRYRHEYYNEAKPSVSDAVYDHLFDELQKLEKKTGIVLGNSPTQTVGYVPVSSLKKVRHLIPLLSLDKTKQTEELLQMAGKAPALLMLKLDGLTIKLVYENGQLVEASTRGDGDIGEVITHNIPAFCNVPMRIPHKERIVITGEGFIHKDDFEKMKKEGLGKEKEACNARNLASGSIRLFNPAACKERHVYFHAFNMLEGMGSFGKIADSRGKLLEAVGELGFDICPFMFLPENATLREIEDGISRLKVVAEEKRIPVDGMVLRYDSLSYSKSRGRTGHHYKDGIAFKFEDDTYETVFRSIEWEPGRSGEIAPVAVFDTVEIDGCSVSKASLHNLSFIRDLELHPGCRVLVSKRNMIIPHIEENFDRGHYSRALIPKKCPCCGKPARVFSRAGDKGRLIETLHCDNPTCGGRTLHKFIHFSGKKAMDISGMSEATIEKFIEKGFLKTFHDFYHLDRHKDEIVRMEGFGEKSYGRIFVTKGNNLGGKGGTYYCTMVKMLLSNSVNETTIHNFASDVRNRIEALLMTTNATSWKCIDQEFRVIPPEEKKARKVYDCIVAKINENKEYTCKDIFNTFCCPPFGMSEDVIVLMIAVVCANLNYCLRFRYDDSITNINNWKELVVIKDKKIDIDVVKKSAFVMVDAGAVTGKYMRFFERIQSNKSISEVISLEKILANMMAVDEIPEELETQYLLARKYLNSGKKANNEWKTCNGEIDEKLEAFIEESNLYDALKGLQLVEAIPYAKIFKDNGYEIDEESKTTVKELITRLKNEVDQQITPYVANMYCKSVEGVNTFRNHNIKMQNMLEELGFTNFAMQIKKRKEEELSNIDEIRSRQELRSDCEKILEESQITKYATYVNICLYLKSGKELQARVEKYGVALGKDAQKIRDNINDRVASLEKNHDRTMQDMSDIWDDLYEVKSAEDVEMLIDNIASVLQKGIPDTDQIDFEELQKNLKELLNDINEIKNAIISRNEFKKNQRV